ncbi:Hypothetical protein DPCES_3438 [Desulfitobacterium hafniense]|uniref:Uncharacterized protein n=1 Tax=Desulfitobacterium hafniense TaxID=49338 RepID=A0A098B3B2_DESHA|nr:hypothetical protein [Desulfitobacterium hafniense]CDX03324.1 Hypothetical protein DPCES_3438 [Desulfitobacterium hafniense]
MTNSDRLLMEIKGIELTPSETEIYLQENSLIPTDEYNPSSNTNKRNILKTALSILESVANQPELMKNYKMDDITVSQFHENLMNRIEQLELKIRQIPNDDLTFQDGASFFYMFRD